MSATPEIMVSPESVDVAGRRRTLTVVHRRQKNPGTVPVVLVLHGSVQTASVIRSFTANTFDHIGAQAGAVVAYLDGYKKHWNDARISNSSAARTDDLDDVAFAAAAIDLLVRRYGGDRARVYAVGFSNGGQMVIRLIHETPSILAGAAILSAVQTVPDDFAPDSPQEQPLPVMFVHGTSDPITPYAGGMAKMWRLSPRGMGLSAQASAAYYARRNGITATPTTTALDATGAGPTKVERTEFRQPGHQPVILYTAHEGGHTIPAPKRKIPAVATRLVLGRTDHTLDTAHAISEFFGLTAHNQRS
jgi:polyhydroxybutyrate depolymerase